MYRLSGIRFQFSLRYALFLFCVLGCVIAYVTDVKRRQKRVQKIVHELGGDIWNVDFNEDGEIKSPQSEWIPSVFYLLIPETYNYVYLTSSELDDAKLKQILELPGIEGVNFSFSSITDCGITMLREKKGLKEIQIYDIPAVTEEAVLQLKASSTARIGSSTRIKEQFP